MKNACLQRGFSWARITFTKKHMHVRVGPKSAAVHPPPMSSQEVRTRASQFEPVSPGRCAGCQEAALGVLVVVGMMINRKT